LNRLTIQLVSTLASRDRVVARGRRCSCSAISSRNVVGWGWIIVLAPVDRLWLAHRDDERVLL
jgi:hypothetical protein